MNYLLDTHTLIWVISEEEKLSSNVIRTLGDTNNTFWVSVISFWEIALQFSTGKLDIKGMLPEELPDLSLETGFKIISLSSEESSTYHNLITTNHKDPFDRMLIWQAIQRNLVFITNDKSISEYKDVGLKILW